MCIVNIFIINKEYNLNFLLLIKYIKCLKYSNIYLEIF